MNAAKRRSESSFGLHFDFHATPAPGKVIGSTLKEEDIREICRLIKPDFIQADCKGHPGWASYPTSLENAMPEFAFDTLALWRKVTAEEGVALYLHYSGVIDERYCKNHPEDAVMNPDGTRSSNITRTLGGYADNLMIPQLKEVAGKYGVDGIWVDGDCWGTAVDFDPETVAAFEKETGIDLKGELPSKPEDRYYEEYRNFCRECYRRYVRHFVDEVHKDYPDFQIASNWAFTDHMPEAVSADVDFLSGDFTPGNSVNSARYAGRAIAQQKRTWDLMAWNFRSGFSSLRLTIPKHPAQIMQEAAAVISLGGGFQNYITQYPDGSPRMEEIRLMKPVADFVREREKYCFRGENTHEAVILLSTYDRALESAGLFSRTGCERTQGLTALMCDSGQQTEIACEHTLRGRCSDYRLIAVPELKYGLDPDMINELIRYAENGGSLLLTGYNTCRVFSGYLPFSADCGDRSGQARYYTADHKYIGVLKDAHTVSAENAETVMWLGDTEKDTSVPGGVIIPFGKGKIGVIASDIGYQYMECEQYVSREVIKAFAGRLYSPDVKVTGCAGLLEINTLIKDGKRYIQLVNASGGHAGGHKATEDVIPPALDITLDIRCCKMPRRMTLRPRGESLDFSYSGGIASVRVGRVDIHEIIEIEE